MSFFVDDHIKLDEKSPDICSDNLLINNEKYRKCFFLPLFNKNRNMKKRIFLEQLQIMNFMIHLKIKTTVNHEK